MKALHVMRRLGAPALAVALVSACATAPPATTPPDPTGPPPVASVAATLDYADQPGEGAELAAGTYVMTAVEPLRIAFTVPDGWYKGTIENVVWDSGTNSPIGFSVADNLFVDPCAPAKGRRDPAIGPTVDDLVTALRTVPGTSISQASDVIVAGFTGKLVDMTGTEAPPCDEALLWESGGNAVHVPGPDDRLSLRILDAGGARLVVSSRTPPDISEDVMAEVQDVIDSIVIDGT